MGGDKTRQAWLGSGNSRTLSSAHYDLVTEAAQAKPHKRYARYIRAEVRRASVGRAEGSAAGGRANKMSKHAGDADNRRNDDSKQGQTSIAKRRKKEGVAMSGELAGWRSRRQPGGVTLSAAPCYMTATRACSRSSLIPATLKPGGGAADMATSPNMAPACVWRRAGETASISKEGAGEEKAVAAATKTKGGRRRRSARRNQAEEEARGAARRHALAQYITLRMARKPAKVGAQNVRVALATKIVFLYNAAAAWAKQRIASTIYRWRGGGLLATLFTWRPAAIPLISTALAPTAEGADNRRRNLPHLSPSL